MCGRRTLGVLLYCVSRLSCAQLIEFSLRQDVHLSAGVYLERNYLAMACEIHLRRVVATSLWVYSVNEKLATNVAFIVVCVRWIWPHIAEK